MAIVIAGHTGLAGSAIFERFRKEHDLVIGINSKVVNLLDRNATFDFVASVKPRVVIDSASYVGGIQANSLFPVDFLSKNIQIQTNLLDACFASEVERVIFLGSSCVYPRLCPQPIKEEYLLSGKLEATNSAYAVAKIAGLELVRAYRRQYQKKWISLMPTNMFGPYDNFSKEYGHVLPSLIARFVEALENDVREISLWGSGRARREFLYSEDLADAVHFCLENYDDYQHLNIGTGVDIEIRELAYLIAKCLGFDGDIIWDESHPDGTPRKVLDTTRINELGWEPKIDFEDGVRRTIDWFLANRDIVRQ